MSTDDVYSYLLSEFAKTMANQIDQEIMGMGSDSLDAVPVASLQTISKTKYKLNKVQKIKYNLPHFYMPVYLKIDNKYKKIALANAQSVSCELETSHTPNDFYQGNWFPVEKVVGGFTPLDAYINSEEIQLKVFPTLHCGFYITGWINKVDYQVGIMEKSFRVEVRIKTMKPFTSKKGFFHESKS